MLFYRKIILHCRILIHYVELVCLVARLSLSPGSAPPANKKNRGGFFDVSFAYLYHYGLEHPAHLQNH